MACQASVGSSSGRLRPALHCCPIILSAAETTPVSVPLVGLRLPRPQGPFFHHHGLVLLAPAQADCWEEPVRP